LATSGFDVYLPKWINVAKITLGLPEDPHHLHSWQFNIFSPFLSSEELQPGEYLSTINFNQSIYEIAD